MKKKISKLVALTSVMVVLITGLTGCSKAECDFCGETARCSTMEILGEEVKICGDCEDGLEALGSLFE